MHSQVKEAIPIPISKTIRTPAPNSLPRSLETLKGWLSISLYLYALQIRELQTRDPSHSLSPASPSSPWSPLPAHHFVTNSSQSSTASLLPPRVHCAVVIRARTALTVRGWDVVITFPVEKQKPHSPIHSHPHSQSHSHPILPRSARCDVRFEP